MQGLLHFRCAETGKTGPKPSLCKQRLQSRAQARQKQDDARMAPGRNLKTTNHQDDARMMRTTKKLGFHYGVEPTVDRMTIG